jgi:hypothetical protein
MLHFKFAVLKSFISECVIPSNPAWTKYLEQFLDFDTYIAMDRAEISLWPVAAQEVAQLCFQLIQGKKDKLLYTALNSGEKDRLPPCHLICS